MLERGSPGACLLYHHTVMIESHFHCTESKINTHLSSLFVGLEQKQKRKKDKQTTPPAMGQAKGIVTICSR